jgi:hypothetical protein
VGPSPPLVNIIWGFAILSVGPVADRARCLVLSSTDEVAALVGGLAISVYLAIHFGKVQSGK